MSVRNDNGRPFSPSFWLIGTWRLNIYHYVPPDRVWPNVFFIVRVLGKCEVRHKPRLMPCWTMLLLDPLDEMWASWPCWDLDSLSAMWVQHVRLLIAWTRLKGLVLCCAVNDCLPTWRWSGQFKTWLIEKLRCKFMV